MQATISGQYFYKNRTLKSVNFFNSEPDLDEMSVYEVFRVENTVSLFLEEHLNRLNQSAKIANIKLWKTNSQIKQAIKTLIAANNTSDGNIKLDFRFKPSGEKEFHTYLLPTNYPTEKQLNEGVLACFQEAERSHPNAKIYNPQVRGQANTIIEKEHVYDTILVNHHGQLTEGSRSNLFFIKGDQLITAPDEMVLQGIIRKKVLEIIKHKGLNISFIALNKEELAEIDSAFITGTSPRLLPLRKINQIGFDVTHPLLIELKNELSKLIENYIEDKNHV